MLFIKKLEVEKRNECRSNKLEKYFPEGVHGIKVKIDG